MLVGGVSRVMILLTIDEGRIVLKYELLNTSRALHKDKVACQAFRSLWDGTRRMRSLQHFLTHLSEKV
jgi:hypothetical protein